MRERHTHTERERKIERERGAKRKRETKRDRQRGEGRRGGGGQTDRELLLGCNLFVYLRDGPAHKSLRVATMRQKLQIKLSTSPNFNILRPGQPVPTRTP